MANWNEYLNPFDRRNESRADERRDRQEYSSDRYRPTDSGRISYDSQYSQDRSQDRDRNEYQSYRDRDESGMNYGRRNETTYDSSRRDFGNRDFSSGRENQGRSYGSRDTSRSFGRDYDRNYDRGNMTTSRDDWGFGYGSGGDTDLLSGASYGGYGRGTDFGSFRRGDDLTYGGSYGRGSGLSYDDRRSSITDYAVGTQASYIGRGPKGWKRSDERIRDDVSESLERHPEIDASEIEVDVKEGIVHLRGSVSDRRQKRLAEDAVEYLTGVKDVRNELMVNQSLFQRAKEALMGESSRTSEGTTTSSKAKH